MEEKDKVTGETAYVDDPKEVVGKKEVRKLPFIFYVMVAAGLWAVYEFIDAILFFF